MSTQPYSDFNSLKLVFNKLLAELSTPYIERRTLKEYSAAMDELADAIQEISNRERSLQVIIGIAKRLLDQVETQVAANTQLSEQLLRKRGRLAALRTEHSALRKELTEKKMILDNNDELLAGAEDKISQLLFELNSPRRVPPPNDFVDQDSSTQKVLRLQRTC